MFDVLKELLAASGVTDAEAITKIVDSAKGLVDAETEKGKGFYREKDSEAKKLRESMRKLGYDSEKFGSVDEYLSTREKETNQKDTTLASLQEALDSLKKDLSSERELRAAEHGDRVKAMAESKLFEAFGNKIYGKKGAILGAIAGNELSLDGDNVTIGGMSVEDYTNEYIKSNPDDVRTSQNNGSGEPPAQVGDIDINNMDTLAFMTGE